MDRAAATEYDPRYLVGILFFNEHDFFEAHEVWESLWLECAGPERRFYQGLIQAAVALLHFGNGNVRGAVKLFRTSRDYMRGLPSPYLGFDVAGFWQQMERCFAELLAHPNPDRSLEPDETLLPSITLDPPPPSWPNPVDWKHDEDQDIEGRPAP
jgi:predicted metal-dependent hydrolase